MKISRNISVDVYRFVLCAFIILFHYTIRFTQLFVNGDFSLWFVPDAYVVVSIFFIISGFFFSIKSLKTFIYKKIWCLYMPFVLSIIIISAVELSLLNLNSISMFDVVSNILVVPVMLGIGKYIDGAHWYIVSLLLFFLVLSVFYLVSKAAKKNKLFYVFVAAYAFLCFVSYRITGSSIAEKAFRIIFSNRLVFACLHAAEHLDLTKPVVFCDCDLAFSNKKANAIDADALLFCFHSKSESYSYVEVDKQGLATRTVEKQVISSNAICGCYCFNRTLDFIVAAKKLIDNNETSEKYMSNVFNYLIDEKKKVKICVVDWQLSFGTPEEYAEVSKDVSLLERLLQNGK